MRLNVLVQFVRGGLMLVSLGCSIEEESGQGKLSKKVRMWNFRAA